MYGSELDRLKRSSFQRPFAVEVKQVRITQRVRIEATAAVGKPGTKETLPEKLRTKESPNDRRKLSESICEGPFGLSAK